MKAVGEIDRQKYIGGSDVAGILGISPWKSPLDVYLDKVQPRIVQPDLAKAKVLNRGKRMEPYVIDLLSEETGLQIVACGNRYLDPELQFIAAEIDAETSCGLNVEIKTVSPFKAKEWGEQKTDAIPVYYTAQAMHGLMVTGRQVCVFGVLIGADDFRVYAIERDDETITAIREKECAFWERVQNLQPPEAVSAADITRMFFKDSGSSIEADGKALEALIKLRELKSQYKTIEQEIETAETCLKIYMQDNSALTVNGSPVVTWKLQTANRFDQKAFQAANADLYKKFTKASESRVFRVK